MNAVHFINADEVKHIVHELLVSVKGGHHLAYVVVCENVGTYLLSIIIHTTKLQKNREP